MIYVDFGDNSDKKVDFDDYTKDIENILENRHKVNCYYVDRDEQPNWSELNTLFNSDFYLLY